MGANSVKNSGRSTLSYNDAYNDAYNAVNNCRDIREQSAGSLISSYFFPHCTRMSELHKPVHLTIPDVDLIPLAELQPFTESEFDVILRRQPRGRVKRIVAPSRFTTLSNDFELSCWGSVSYIKLTEDDIRIGEEVEQMGKEGPTLGPWMASAVAANEVFGSVFYAFPPVIAAAGVYSPISLLIATSLLFLWRPIIEELTSAIAISGSNYTFLINATTKAVALTGGALALLDYSTTSVVSAATAAEYIAGETTLPFPKFIGTLIFSICPLVISLLGLRESARTAFGILTFHMATMVALTLAALISWIRNGNSLIHSNWIEGQPGSPSGIIHQIFNGVCLGIVGMTGFECSPDYVAVVRSGAFPKVLRNIHYPTMGLYALLMLVVLANIPLDVMNNSPNVLSVLAERAGGRWFRIWVVVDASIVLSAGVLTGILSACALFEKLAQDRILPTAILYRLPQTGSQAVAIASFMFLGVVLYSSAGANLVVISKMFAMTWLSVMILFPVSLLFLKFNRGRIPRALRASLALTVFTLLVGLTAFAGNIAIDPTTVGYFAAYSFAIWAAFLVTNNKARIIRCVYWIYDQSPIMHNWRWAHRLSECSVKYLRSLRRQPVCVLTRTDEMHHLFEMISYVAKNEEASCVKLVHLYQSAEDIPSEIEANAKLLDEAFPGITIDLIFVQGPLTPCIIAALAHRLQIPRALMFMSCPGPEFKAGSFAELGTRIISL